MTKQSLRLRVSAREIRHCDFLVVVFLGENHLAGVFTEKPREGRHEIFQGFSQR